MRLLQVTDTHLFADPSVTMAGGSPQRGYEAVMADLAARESGADALLLTGDLSHDGSEAAYRRLRRTVEPLASRVLVLPGNHDEPARMARLFRSGLTRWVMSEVVGDWHLVLLDTARHDSAAGRLGEQQLVDLEQHLRRRPEHPTLVALHHPPVAVGAPWLDAIGLADGEALLACLARHPQVRVATFGHVHQAFDDWYGGLRLLATPATSFQFLPGSTAFALDDRPPGYRWLDLAENGDVRTGVVRFEVG